MKAFLHWKTAVQVGVVLLLLAGETACAGSGAGRSAAASSSDNDPDVISQEEIQAAGTTTDAYSLLQRLKPAWLRSRGRSSIRRPAPVFVYVDDTRYGPPTVLRRIQVIDVASVEFLNAGEATARYGSGHSNGVILLHMKSGRQKRE